MLISGNTISHNTAEWGGGISPSGNDVMINGNTISFNSATNDGGGVFVGEGDGIKLIGNTIISMIGIRGRV